MEESSRTQVSASEVLFGPVSMSVSSNLALIVLAGDHLRRVPHGTVGEIKQDALQWSDRIQFADRWRLVGFPLSSSNHHYSSVSTVFFGWSGFSLAVSMLVWRTMTRLAGCAQTASPPWVRVPLGLVFPVSAVIITHSHCLFFTLSGLRRRSMTHMPVFHFFTPERANQSSNRVEPRRGLSPGAIPRLSSAAPE